jgi:hypothetical protein
MPNHAKNTFLRQCPRIEEPITFENIFTIKSKIDLKSSSSEVCDR